MQALLFPYYRSLKSASDKKNSREKGAFALHTANLDLIPGILIWLISTMSEWSWVQSKELALRTLHVTQKSKKKTREKSKSQIVNI